MSDVRLLAEAAEAVLAELDDAPTDPWQPLRENGWIGVAVAPSAGGQGGSLVEAAVLAQAAGRTAAAAPVVEAIASAVLASAVEQPTAEIERIVSGDTAATLLQETLPAESGISTAGGRWQAAWARGAHAVLAVARGPNDGASRLVCLGPGTFEVEEAVNIAGEPRDRVQIDTPIPGECCHALRWPEMDVLATLGVLHSARQLGALEQVHALSLDHANERQQFGRPIGSFQAVAHSLVRQVELLELARSALLAAVLLEDTPQFIEAALAARVTANTASGACARIAHQTLGAIGVTREHPLAGFTLRLAAWRQELHRPSFWERELGERVARAGTGWWEHVADGVDLIPQDA